MNQTLKYTLFLVLLFTLISCTSNNVAKDYKLEPSSGMGLIIGSISTNFDKKNPNYPIAAINYFFKSSTEVSRRRIENRPATAFKFYSEFDDYFGRVFVIAVPEGTYMFGHYAFGFNMIQGHQSRNPPSIPVDVVSGKATYIGNLHMEFVSKNLPHGIPIVIDQSKRDLDILRNKHPNITDDDIVKSVIENKWIAKAIPSEAPK